MTKIRKFLWVVYLCGCKKDQINNEKHDLTQTYAIVE